MFISIGGLRRDGRKPNEVRRLDCSFDVKTGVDGSAKLSQGLNTVVVSVQGPRQSSFRAESGSVGAPVRCNVYASPFSTTERKKRRANDRKLLSFAGMLEDIFTGAIRTSLFHKSQIDINVHILQTDGSYLAPSINAISLALINAGIPLRGFVCACTASFIQDEYFLDLNYSEEAADAPILTLAIFPKTNDIIALKMASPRSRMAPNLLMKLSQTAISGCQQIYQNLEAKVIKHAKLILNDKSQFKDP